MYSELGAFWRLHANKRLEHELNGLRNPVLSRGLLGTCPGVPTLLQCYMIIYCRNMVIFIKRKPVLPMINIIL